MAKVNSARGEVELKLGERSYVLRPEHERAVMLDDALEKGILGTVLQLTTERVIKVRTLATIVYYLADDPPEVPVLIKQIMDEPLLTVMRTVSIALTAISTGTRGDAQEGEGEAQSDRAIDSTGTSG